MFAKRVVTKAVTKTCLFCDACMRMVAEEDDFTVVQFLLTAGSGFKGRSVKKRDRYIVCKDCYVKVTGSYEAHKQLIKDGSESCFQREGITEREMRALFELSLGKNAGVAEPVPAERSEAEEEKEEPQHGLHSWLRRLPLKAAAL